MQKWAKASLQRCRHPPSSPQYTNRPLQPPTASPGNSTQVPLKLHLSSGPVLAWAVNRKTCCPVLCWTWFTGWTSWFDLRHDASSCICPTLRIRLWIEGVRITNPVVSAVGLHPGQWGHCSCLLYGHPQLPVYFPLWKSSALTGLR